MITDAFSSLRTKIVVAVVSVVMLGFTATIYTISHKASDMQKALALQYAEASAQKSAAGITDSLQEALTGARTVADALEGMKVQGVANRDVANAILRRILEKNPQLLGIWAVWEPNAFDGRDRQYIRAPGSDATGRYLPYWRRSGTRISLDLLRAKDRPGLEQYYFAVRRSGREMISEPYIDRSNDKPVRITSLIVPIQVNDRFIGAAGVDLPISLFQEAVSRLRPYGTGYATLISNAGQQIAGRPLAGPGQADTLPAQDEKQAVEAGKLLSKYEYSPALGTNVYRVFVPIETGHTSAPWSFAVTVPMNQVLAGVESLRNLALLIGFISVTFLLVIIVIALNEIVNKPLRAAMGIARRLADGNMNTQIEVTSRDEMGQLLLSMREMAEKITQMKRVETELTVTYTQIAIARRIQQSLFPAEPPQVQGVVLAGRCIPAAQVGGDYFDYFQRSDTCVDIFISDVSGHGIGSALLMAEARSILKASAYLSNSAAEIFARLNASLYDDLDHAEQFITMFYAKYNARSRVLSYASAGHNPPMLLRPLAQQCMQLDAEGMILGIKRDIHFEERQARLESGDIVFFYTDGVTEAADPSGQQYGTGRLHEFLLRHAAAAPEQLLEAALVELRQFCQCETFGDDVTIVVMKVA